MRNRSKGRSRRMLDVEPAPRACDSRVTPSYDNSVQRYLITNDDATTLSRPTGTVGGAGGDVDNRGPQGPGGSKNGGDGDNGGTGAFGAKGSVGNQGAAGISCRSWIGAACSVS